ncbi:MAG: class I SAM-dependent methyltransferase [Pyrinomonadaceae bacterium]
MHNSYDFIAKDWHASRTGFAARKYVDLILSRLISGARLLDLGCGTGAPITEYLVEHGFRVVGVDQSAAMLEIASRVVPEAELIQADMCELSLAERFAAVIAWDSIFHVPRDHHRAIFQRVFSLLDSNGWFLLSAGGSGQEGFTSEMFGQTFFYSGYEPEEALDLLRAEGFAIDLCEEDDPTSRGHIAIIARKVTEGTD